MMKQVTRYAAVKERPGVLRHDYQLLWLSERGRTVRPAVDWVTAYGRFPRQGDAVVAGPAGRFRFRISVLRI